MQAENASKCVAAAALCSIIATAGPAAAAPSEGPPLDVVLERVAEVVDGTILAIEPRRVRGDAGRVRALANPRYFVVVASQGAFATRVVELGDRVAVVDESLSRDHIRPVPESFTATMARGPLSLQEVVRRAHDTARGFDAREAEYESERGQFLAEVELARGATVIELVMDAFTGDVVELELESGDDDDDDDDGDDDDDDDYGDDDDDDDM